MTLFLCIMAWKKNEIDKTFNVICKEIAINGKALRNVLKSKGMPSNDTFYKWIDNDSLKMEQYVRACEERANGIFEDMLVIADTPEEGVTTKQTEKGVEITTADMIAHRRLKVETRKWILGKMNPKKYSDKIQVDNTEFKEQPLFDIDG